MGASLNLLRFAHEGTREDGGLCFDEADLSPEGRRELEAQGATQDELRGAQTNLSGRSFSGVSLRSANLSETDLGEADFSDVSAGGAAFRSARLESTQFRNADLVGADLSDVFAGEADFESALLEDAKLKNAQLRFANFTDAMLDGADLSHADLWGAKFGKAAGERIQFHHARLDESNLAEADFASAEFYRATLRRADLSQARLVNANFNEANLEGANLAGANLKGASLSNVSLASCKLTRAFFAGAWLERTRMRAHQVGGCVGEEAAGDLEGAIDSYLVLERNFVSLGSSQDASWAYLQRRKVERQLHRKQARAELEAKRWAAAFRPSALWLGDIAAEWLCNYGESLYRVARAFFVILLVFALTYWLTGSLRPREGFSGRHLQNPINYLLFSLNSMTTVGTSEIALRPRGELGTLLSSVQTVLGTVLLGLFGFVLGARIRN